MGLTVACEAGSGGGGSGRPCSFEDPVFFAGPGPDSGVNICVFVLLALIERS
jgi:hypothetical protein